MFRPRCPATSAPAFSSSELCALCVSAFSPLSSFCSGGPSDPCSSPLPDSLYAAIPFRIIFFAHPHHLTPIESYSCKKQGRGAASNASTRPKPFLFFPHRVNIQRTETPASSIFSSVYLTVLWIPGGGVCRQAPPLLLTTHYSLLTIHYSRSSPRTSTLPPRIYGIIPPHKGTNRNPICARGGFSD
jgi:hypothetical protein